MSDDRLIVELDIEAKAMFDRDKFVPARMADEIKNQLVADYLVTPVSSDIMYRYNGDTGIYTPDGEAWVAIQVARILDEEATSAKVKEVVALLKIKTYDFSDYFYEETPRVIVLKNGVYDLNKKELYSFSPLYRSFSRLPVKYDPNAECPEIDKFLKEVAANDDAYLLLEWLAYCLVKHYKIQKALMLNGGGENGKGTYLNLVTAFLGPENVSNQDLYSITSNRFAKAELFGKLANIAPDLSSDELKRTGNFKALTGGDRIEAEKKHQNPFYFYNHAKLMFSANKLPISPDQSRAFFRRWCIITFNQIFEGDKKDPDKLAKITTDAELSGLLNKALKALLDLEARGDFIKTQTTDELQTLYEKMADPVTAFIKDCIEIETGTDIPKEVLYNVYYNYCRFRNYNPETKETFAKLLKPKIIGLGEQRISYGSKKKRLNAWVGIRLRCQGCQGCQGAMYLAFEMEDLLKEKRGTLDTLDTLDIRGEEAES